MQIYVKLLLGSSFVWDMQGQGLMSLKFNELNKSYLTLVPQATLQKIINRALSTKTTETEKQSFPFI